MTQTHQSAALDEVREEYSKYFEALEQHPRTMVGMEVPSLTGEGLERIQDTNDAREWQDAVKGILIQEVRDRAGRAIEEQQSFIETVHNSIKLFQDNAELIPGSREFDSELANRFATMAKPYELRVDGKLNGYTIPVQPIIDSLRGQLKAERAAAPAQAASSPASTGAAQQSPPVAQPQAGIQSKAGSSGNEENFDTLFGTLGIGPGFRI